MNITLPPDYNSLAQALVSLFGNSVAIAETDRLHGGDINKAYGLTLNNGKKIFKVVDLEIYQIILSINQSNK